jgi:hypothetical protein
MDFDVTEQVIIKHSAFVKLSIIMGIQCTNTPAIYRLPEGM